MKKVGILCGKNFRSSFVIYNIVIDMVAALELWTRVVENVAKLENVLTKEKTV